MRTEALALTLVAGSDDFAELYATHHAEALRLAYLLCGDPHRAEDAVAEVFAKIYRRTRRHTVEQPRAYIRRAVVNEVNSRFRRLALERREASRRSGDDRGARGVEEQHADADVVFAALQVLPRRQRTAVVLRYYADLSEADTAEVMGVSIGTVKSSVFRGLERMRAAMGTQEV